VPVPDRGVMMGSLIGPIVMAATTTSSRLSKRFITPAARLAGTLRPLESGVVGRRDSFAEGLWASIKVRLEMAGWSPSQIDLIHEQLRQGWTLPMAVRHVAMRHGACPLRSRPLG